MSLNYLIEHAESARLSLLLAQKQQQHLQYTHQSLFSVPINQQWIEALETNEALSEKIEAFVARFSRLQDYIGEKLIPRFALLVGQTPKSLLDNLNFAEKMGWLEDAATFIQARKLRNLLVHEYMHDPELFLQTLNFANQATFMLNAIVNNFAHYAETIDL
jgi:hypothetical protein